MTEPHPISIERSFEELTFLADRTPATTDDESAGAFARLAEYRDGAVFAAHWAGHSGWERHPVGDEIVIIIAGETTITFLGGDGERSSRMNAGELVVVPQGIWHRFDTPHEVQVLAVTPQPTEHRFERPD